ncbi:MAG: hypothetical protein ACKOCD_01730 [Nitrospiraceae bacterium]
MAWKRTAGSVLAAPALAGGLACLYLVLAVAASLCVFGHVPAGSGSHHHGQTLSHSLLCAWACQATSATLAVKVEVASAPMLIGLSLALSRSASWPNRTFSLIDARAPPLS